MPIREEVKIEDEPYGPTLSRNKYNISRFESDSQLGTEMSRLDTDQDLINAEYESIAMIPIKAKGEKKKGAFADEVRSTYYSS